VVGGAVVGLGKVVVEVEQHPAIVGEVSPLLPTMSRSSSMTLRKTWSVMAFHQLRKIER
jgi:hypothetical protein